MADVESPGESISLADAILMLDGSTNDTDRIADYEQMFSQRFTEADVDFMTVLNSANPPPPCIENWYSRPKRTFDWTRGNADHRGGRGGQRGYNRPWRGHDDRARGRDDRGRDDRGRDDRSGWRPDRGHDYNRDHRGGGRVNYAGMKEDYGEHQSKYRRMDDRGRPQNY